PKVVELGIYNGIPHLLVPVVTDPRKASGALGWAVSEMEKRYKMFADRGVRDLAGYNRFVENLNDPEIQKMPHIVIIIDELADLMMTAPNEVEDSINRIAAKARAAGMHLIIATQRPSVDVVTGVIKANIPTRIAFAVSSQVDSRTILDSAGAEKLLGRGDMLFSPVGSNKPNRIQGCFVSDEEVEAVVECIKNGGTVAYDDDVMVEIERQAAVEKKQKTGLPEDGPSDDPMLDEAIKVVVENGMASTSLLQRKLKLGYARAARIVDEMEQRGVVGPYEGSKPRKVLITKEQLMEREAMGEE
ncbi:MAG: FtsK/SpoIIIE domain-containing protein, partial [Acutalibacteraceae bacterium]|nr:FtsK/SpoIIIE domain-containing protein [Acutalibacteraceae bacterium]